MFTLSDETFEVLCKMNGREDVIREILRIMPDEKESEYLKKLSLGDLIERLQFFLNLEKSAKPFIKK